MLVAHIASENPWIAAPASWMRFRTSKWTIRGSRSAVSTEADKRRTHGRAHVVLIHHEVDRTGLSVIRENQIKQSIQRIFLLFVCDLRNSLSLKTLELAVNN